jgi:hypothetical protein
MNKKRLEVLEFRLGVDIADEIRRKTDAMASIELNLAKVSASREKKDDKGVQWLAKCALVSGKITELGEITKEQICELVGLKDTQLSIFTGKLRNYLRVDRKMDLIKRTTGDKTSYFIRPIEPTLQTAPTPPQQDQQIVPQQPQPSPLPAESAAPENPA